MKLLARPGMLVKLLVENDVEEMKSIVETFFANYSSSTAVNYLTQLKMFLDKSYDNYKPDIIQALEMSEIRASSLISRVVTLLVEAIKKAKRELKHNQHVRQEIKAKISDGRIPPPHLYSKIGPKTDAFLRTAVRNFREYMKRVGKETNTQDQDCVWMDEDSRYLHKHIQNYVRAITIHFLWNSDGQRGNQYQEIKTDEFYALLVEYKVDINGRPSEYVHDKAKLDNRDARSHSMIDSFRNIVRQRRNFDVVVRRIPTLVDKKVRGKDTLWHRWHCSSLDLVWIICDYALNLKSMLQRLSLKVNFKGLDEDYMIFHSQKLKPLNANQLKASMTQWWNLQMNGRYKFATVCGWNVWRHAFCTNEMHKYSEGKDYTWCQSLNDAAEEVALKINSSGDEVMNTYSTRCNVPGVASKVPVTTQFMLNDDDLIHQDHHTGQKRKEPPGGGDTVLTPPPSRASRGVHYSVLSPWTQETTDQTKWTDDFLNQNQQAEEDE